MAAATEDKIERFKFLISTTIGSFPVSNNFLKPLNPIIGETFEASYMDGTKLYNLINHIIDIQNRYPIIPLSVTFRYMEVIRVIYIVDII